MEWATGAQRPGRDGWGTVFFKLNQFFFIECGAVYLRNQREKSKIYKKAKTKYRPYESTNYKKKQSKLQGDILFSYFKIF